MTRFRQTDALPPGESLKLACRYRSAIC